MTRPARNGVDVPSVFAVIGGPANVAAARGVTLHRVSAAVRGDWGILGLSDTVRNGCRQVRVSFEIEGGASPRKSPHWSSGPGRGRPSMTWWSSTPPSSSTSPRPSAA